MTQQRVGISSQDMWSPASGFELRWYVRRQGPELHKELQFRQRLSHSQGWETDKWSDWKAVPIVSEAGLHSQ